MFIFWTIVALMLLCPKTMHPRVDKIKLDTYFSCDTPAFILIAYLTLDQEI
jgi:hypothetical protein